MLCQNFENRCRLPRLINKVMQFSKHNIISQIRGSEQFYIVNILSGNADILEAKEASMLNDLRTGGHASPEFIEKLIENGYWVDESLENRTYKNRYLDFLDQREKDEVQLFFVPNYTCNFDCAYCYQDEYVNPSQELTREIIDSFYKYVQQEFASRKKYITIFGGEPLLGSPKQKELISYLLQKANEAQVEVCIVTNGYTLQQYTDILLTARIREIQVTLDGTAFVHDARRYLKGGGGTFDQIVKGIDACLNNQLPVNLRVVVDNENLNNLPELSHFAIEKGWTKSPWFKTQMGRNYELHHCQSASEKLFSRISLFENLYNLTKEYPHILEFYKPAYSVSKFLADNGALPEPLFDSCPACKTEWAFDYTGHIFSCTATVGKQDESLGTFYPEVKKDLDKIGEWENRDVIAIEECKECSLQLACGGGCGSVAKNNSNKICSTDCRPVKELLEIGFAAYSKDFQQ
jgi:uncharacterized protein